ncbi:hypothetical protein [Pseudomonas sp. LS_1]|uniref:hypothetical protein n=1 Tax=Pseudomonas sp. LS_1 TaxID=3055788 RepID=UPI0035C14866
MNNFMGSVLSFLPLCIERVEWDGDSLVVSGDDWSFSTSSAWRVSKGKELSFACWDEDAAACIEGLVHLSVIDFSWVRADQPIDPSFIFCDGRRLDVFCSFSSEPWVLRLPGDGVYLGNS